MEFSEIALAKLLQQLPELANFIVTFKDVTEELNREEDNTQVGIFILSFGGKYYYLPIIGKNDVVQPIDSLFDPEDQSFIPLIKPFLEKLISSQSESFGSRKRIPSTVTHNPSVYELVVPPRTGKFVYSSSSRFVEFLAATPGHVKKAFAGLIGENRSFAEGLNKHFDLSDIIKALKHVKDMPRHAPVPNEEQLSVVTGGSDLSEHEIQSIINKGYALRGVQKETRVAVPANDFSAYGSLNQISGNDFSQDFEIVMKSGEKHDAFVPRPIPYMFGESALLSRRNDGLFLLFSNGDYAQCSSAVANGPGIKEGKVLKSVFGYCGVITPAQIINGDKVLLLNSDMEMIGVYSIHHTAISSTGLSLRGTDELRGVSRDIFVSRSCIKAMSPNKRDLFIPHNTIVIRLGSCRSNDLETNIASAQSKLELNTLMTLGAIGQVGFDGVEYSYNGKPVGGEPKIIEILVVKEGINPTVADNFVKQAQENKSIKFYMSKKAEFTAGDIPSYGEYSPPQEEFNQFGSGFVPNVQNSMETNDPQTIESTLISELLQAPNMEEYIIEYLPDIKSAMDKLGRVILLSRINMSKLFTGDNASEVFSFISSLRNVYRLLGENYIKLERLSQSSINDRKPAAK